MYITWTYDSNRRWLAVYMVRAFVCYILNLHGVLLPLVCFPKLSSSCLCSVLVLVMVQVLVTDHCSSFVRFE